MKMFMMFCFSLYECSFFLWEWICIEICWIWPFWVKRVPENKSTPVFNAVLYFFKAVPAYQEMDAHGRMSVTFKQTHILSTFDAFSFFIIMQ
jgi:hypothetical protein